MRKEKNAPRPIDLDILFYGAEVIDRVGLRVPHPRLHEREFVLKPLADIAPEWIHPQFNKSIQELYEGLKVDERNQKS